MKPNQNEMFKKEAAREKTRYSGESSRKWGPEGNSRSKNPAEIS